MTVWKLKKGYTFFLITFSLCFFIKEASAQKILIVNDVQADFLAPLAEEEKAKLIGNIKNKIEEAIKLNQKILFVQFTADFDDPGPIEPALLDAVSGYGNFTIVKKHQKNDGSEEIRNELAKSGTRAKRFQICGMNTAFCVRDTIEGLLKSVDQIKSLSVIEPACSDLHGKSFHEGAVRYLYHLPKVEIVSENPILAEFNEGLVTFLDDKSIDPATLSWVNMILDQDADICFMAGKMLAFTQFDPAILGTLSKSLIAVYEGGNENSQLAVSSVFAHQFRNLGRRKIGEEGGLDLIKYLEKEQWDEGETLFFNNMIKLFIQAAGNSDSNVKSNVTSILSEVVEKDYSADESILDALQIGLEDELIRVRTSSALGLYRSQRKSLAIPVIRDLLRDPSLLDQYTRSRLETLNLEE